MTSQPAIAAVERSRIVTSSLSSSRPSDGMHVRTKNIVPQKRTAEDAIAVDASFSQITRPKNDGRLGDDYSNSGTTKQNINQPLYELSTIIPDETKQGSQLKDAVQGKSSLTVDGAVRKTQDDFAAIEAPFPPRPGSHNNAKASSGSSCKRKSRTSVKDFGCQVHQLLSTAPLCSLRRKGPEQTKDNTSPRIMDFYPWTGDHPEDVLSEQAIKSGNYDKLSSSHPNQQIQRETSSARPFLWPQLKSKTGLQTLSAVFVTAMERRQAHRQLDTVVALRPPPRVTLTEQKREAWLRDLANPAKELRKLSKSIPHGIRGRALMGQCLAKNVPTARAVWFAKCVGANEMRAFRRKGTAGSLATVGSGSGAIAGENKWIREWTVQVEQFVEDVIATCGQPEWKKRMNYTLYLAAHIFEQRLLDRAHYLDWLLGSLENAKPNGLPIWLFMIKIYWNYLTTYRKSGRRLAEVMLAHLLNVEWSSLRVVPSHAERSQSDSTPGLSVGIIYNQLCESVATLVVSNKGSLILPNTWHKYNQLLNSLPEVIERPGLTIAIKELTRRNNSIVSERNNSMRNESFRKDLVHELDKNGRHLKVDDLKVDALAIRVQGYTPSEPQEAIITTLQWATSIYREGEYRIYLAVRLLRIWHRQGYDVNSVIQKFILYGAMECKRRDIYMLIGNLVRSKDFSVEQYLRWLISHGFATEQPGLISTLPCHVQLLSELCLQGLPEHVLNLRRSQLSRAGSNVQREADELQTAKDHILYRLDSICESDHPRSPAVAAQCRNIDLENMSMTSKFATSLWLRSHIAKLMSTKKDNTSISHVELEAGSNITTVRFYTLVNLFEKLGDFPVLADVIGILLSTESVAVLTSISNTLQNHSETFCAIGAFEKLSRLLLERFRLISQLGQQLPERRLVSSLIKLESHRPLRDAHTITELTSLLSRCDQRLINIVCSPASDNMGGDNMQPEFEDEIDRVLCSGNSMDEHLMTRLFTRIMDELEREVSLKQSCPAAYSRWLPMLRSFNEARFDRKISGWISRTIKTQKYSVLRRAAVFLVGIGCMSVGVLTTAANQNLSLNDSIDAVGTPVDGSDGYDTKLQSEAAMHCVIMLFSEDQRVQGDDAEHYHIFSLDRDKYASRNRLVLLRVIRHAIECASRDDYPDLFPLLDSALTSSKLLSFLRSAALEEPDFEENFRLHQLDSHRSEEHMYLEKILEGLVDPGKSNHFFKLSLSEQVVRLISITNEISLPFCQLIVRYLHGKDIQDTPSDKQGSPSLYNLAFNAIGLSIERGRYGWSELFEVLMGDLAPKIRDRAETKILNAAAAHLKSPDCVDIHPFSSVDGLEAYLENFLNAAIRSSGNSKNKYPPTLPLLVSTLTTLLRMSPSTQINPNDDHEKKPAFPPDDRVQRGLYCTWVRTLITLALLHRKNLPASTSNHEYIAMASTIGAFLRRKEVKLDYFTHQYVYDVCIVLSDDLADETRAQVLNNITGKSTTTASTTSGNITSADPHLEYIFGSLPAADTWPGLMVTTSQPSISAPSPSSASASTPTLLSTATSTSTASTMSTASTSATSISPSTSTTPIQTPGINTNTNTNTANPATPSTQSPSVIKRHASFTTGQPFPQTLSQQQQPQPPLLQQQQQQPQQHPLPPLPPPPQVTPQMIQRRRSGMAAPLQPTQSQSQSQFQSPSQSQTQPQPQPQPPQLDQPPKPAQQIMTPFTLKRWDLLPDLSLASAGTGINTNSLSILSGGPAGVGVGVGGIGSSGIGIATTGPATATATTTTTTTTTTIPNDNTRLSLRMFGARMV